MFLERPTDVRALRNRTSRRHWLSAARLRPVIPKAGVINVVPTSTLVPGHRTDLAQRLDAHRLLMNLKLVEHLAESTVVATQPWQWPAVRACAAKRLVFDCADDWTSLIPTRRGIIERLERQIGVEADAVIAVNADLESRFARELCVVPNGTGSELLSVPSVARPSGPKRMIYVGTMSERFDTQLVRDVMTRLTDWTLDLYGPCAYAGHGAKPADDLGDLISWADGRIRWHGTVVRSRLIPLIDSANVAVIPHRQRYTLGQDSMKLYDYAARARPIVATPGLQRGTERLTAGIFESASAADFASNVIEAAGTSDEALLPLRVWAERHAWPERWKQWHRAALMGAGQ